MRTSQKQTKRLNDTTGVRAGVPEGWASLGPHTAHVNVHVCQSQLCKKTPKIGPTVQGGAVFFKVSQLVEVEQK